MVTRLAHAIEVCSFKARTDGIVHPQLAVRLRFRSRIVTGATTYGGGHRTTRSWRVLALDRVRSMLARLTYDSNISKGHQDQRMCMPLDLQHSIPLSTLSQYKCHTSAHQPKCIQADLFTEMQYSPALRLNSRGSVRVILPANRNMILDSTSPLTPRPSLFRNLGRFSRHHIDRTSSLESCLLHCFVGIVSRCM